MRNQEQQHPFVYRTISAGAFIRTADFQSQNVVARYPKSSNAFLNSNPISPHSPLYNTRGMPYAPLHCGTLTTLLPSNPRLKLQRCFLSTPHHKRDTVPLSLLLSPRNVNIRGKG